MAKIISCVAAVCIFVLATAATTNGPVSDEQYIALFNQHFHQRSAPVELHEIASVKLYDSLFMGQNLNQALTSLSNEEGGLAWGLAYRMISLNEMFRITGDAKYLQANLRCSQAVMAVRDDRTGTKNFRGQILPAWTCSKYTGRGRTVFLVHTGMIIYPILDAIHLAKTTAGASAKTKAQFDELLLPVLESLHLHDRQWRDGPTAGEGCYIGYEQEQVLEGKPLPANRLSAIGRCLWTAWLITNDSQYRAKAVALGGYIKRRLPVGEDGAFYWPYAFSATPVSGTVQRTRISGEDTSHATLTISFPMMLANSHEVFNDDDMRRFARTVTNGWARLGGGVLFGDVTGSPRSSPDFIVDPAGWICLSAFDPAVKTHILPFYDDYDRTLRPQEMADLLSYLATVARPAGG